LFTNFVLTTPVSEIFKHADFNIACRICGSKKTLLFGLTCYNFIMAQESFLKYLKSSLLTLVAFLIAAGSGILAATSFILGETIIALISGVVAVVAFFYMNYGLDKRDRWRMGRR